MAKKKTNKGARRATHSGTAKRSTGVSSKNTASSAKKKTPAGSKRTGTAKRKTVEKGVRTGGGAAKRGGPARAVTRGKTAKRSTVTSPPDGQSPAPSPVTDATNGDDDVITKPRPRIKTPLSAKELREFKKRLLDKRSELVTDVDHLTRDALGVHQRDRPANLSTMPIHMADLGSDNWEQEFTLGLIANEKELVRDIDDALDRIADRTYGVCLATERPIPLARLRAKPWARYGIEYARQRDGARGR